MHSLMSPSRLGAITVGLTHGVGPATGSIMSNSTNCFSFSSTRSRSWNGVRRSGWATGVTLGSTCSVICVSFILPSPVNTSGNSWRNCSAWLVTAPTSIPTFIIPSFVAVCFPNSGTPLPFTTTNSAFSLPFPARTSHSNVPVVSSGLSEAYAYICLFCGAASDVHFMCFALSCSHVRSSMTLL